MFDIPEELKLLQSVARRFVNEELIPLESIVPEGEGFSAEQRERLERKAKEIGLWALAVPEEYGGSGAGVLAHTLVVEELAKSLLGIEIEIAGNPLPILYGATEEQKERYLLPVVAGEKLGAFALTESTGGSDPAGNMQTTAVQDGARWVINGRKCFISGGERADYVVVFALTDREKRQRGGVTAFIVDKGTPGFSVVRTIPMMGLLAPAELDFQDCVVDDRQRLGDVGQGFILAQQLLGRARMAIGARGVGMCERLTAMAIDYAKSRLAFGKPLSERQAIQWMIADSAIEIDACRWMTYRAAGMADRGRDTRLQDSMIKIYASEMMGRVADRVLQIFGGWGYSKDLPIERFFREARLWRIVEGPNEVHRWVVSRVLFQTGMSVLSPS